VQGEVGAADETAAGLLSLNIQVLAIGIVRPTKQSFEQHLAWDQRFGKPTLTALSQGYARHLRRHIT
jgi:hypothetical protein